MCGCLRVEAGMGLVERNVGLGDWRFGNREVRGTV